MWPAAAPAAFSPCDSVAPAASAAAFLAAPASSTPIGSDERSQTTPARVNTLAIISASRSSTAAATSAAPSVTISRACAGPPITATRAGPSRSASSTVGWAPSGGTRPLARLITGVRDGRPASFSPAITSARPRQLHLGQVDLVLAVGGEPLGLLGGASLQRGPQAAAGEQHRDRRAERPRADDGGAARAGCRERELGTRRHRGSYPHPTAWLPGAFGEAAAEPLAGRLDLGEGRRLLHELEVDDALAERVEPVGADDRVERHARLARARADLADELALQRLLVELALAGHDRARGAHAHIERQRVEEELRARLERGAVRRPQAAAQPAGRPRHRHAPRIAREPARERVEPLLQPRHHGGIGALLRSVDRGRALERRADVAQDDDPRAAGAAVGVDRLDGAGAAVSRGRAADADEHDLRAGVDRGADQLAGAVRGRLPG